MINYSIDYSDLNLDGLTDKEIFQIGKDYNNGRGGKEVDYDLAEKYYGAAADKGYVDAQYNLALMYAHKSPPDYEKALYWFRKAAEQGDAEAKYFIGFYYQHGIAVEQDYKQAIKWYEAAAVVGDADSLSELGLMYTKGEGVPQDYAKAIEYFTKGADGGSTGARYNLAKAYYYGNGVEKDIPKAFSLAEKLVFEGYTEAIGVYTRIYANEIIGDLPNKEAAETKKQVEENIALASDCKEDKAPCFEVIDKITELSSIARNGGLLALEGLIPGFDDVIMQIGVQIIVDAFEPELVEAILEAIIVSMDQTGVELSRQVVIMRGVLFLQNGVPTIDIKQKLYGFLGEDFIIEQLDEKSDEKPAKADSDNLSTLLENVRPIAIQLREKFPEIDVDAMLEFGAEGVFAKINEAGLLDELPEFTEDYKTSFLENILNAWVELGFGGDEIIV